MHSFKKKEQPDQKRLSKFFTKNINNQGKGNVLIFGNDWPEFTILQSFILKAFEKLGYTPIIIIKGPITKIFYHKFGYNKFINLYSYISCNKTNEASNVINTVKSQGDLLKFKWQEVRCGKYAASFTMRKLRRGKLILNDNHVLRCLLEQLIYSMSCAEAANKIIDQLQPKAMICVDRGYPPEGEFFDVCINKSIPCYTWNVAHKHNTLMLKKYTINNHDMHPSSLSGESWEKINQISWDEDNRKDLFKELKFCYASGQWYSGAGTQFNRQFIDNSELINLLQLDPNKKTAVIFPHLFWDASFFWGEDLFENYEDWFIQTVQAACKNNKLNWLIKVHPANIVKDKRDGITGERSEIRAIKEAVTQLPAHVKVLDADCKISTWSLFQVLDYCLTVRGTVGIEAALLGKAVLTAGTGRYDRKGFTLDFETKEDYLNCLSHLQDVQLPDSKQIELAQRFAYGIFCCRPLHLKSVKVKFLPDEKASMSVEFLANSFKDLDAMEDLNQISEWIQSGKEDFFMCEGKNK